MLGVRNVGMLLRRTAVCLYNNIECLDCRNASYYTNNVLYDNSLLDV